MKKTRWAVIGAGGIADRRAIPGMLLGMLAAAVSGYFAIGLLNLVLKKNGLRYFSYYMILIGIVTIAVQFIGFL